VATSLAADRPYDHVLTGVCKVTLAGDKTAAVRPEDGSPDTVWGAGSLARLGETCARAGITRVLAVAGRSADGVAARLPDLLGQRYLGRWSDVPAHVPAHQASLAVGSAQETHADGVVAVGGGSAIGLAKIVALALRLPLIAVPTTYSGAEMTSRYVVTTDQGAETGTSPRALATSVIYDTDLTATMPPHVAAASGVTAVAHCVEALCYPDTPAGTRDWAREGLLLLWGSLGQVVAGTADPSCGQDALAGASMAGRVHQAAGPGLLHLLCDLMAARPDVSYGALQALLLPLVLSAHGPRAGQARAAISELRPEVPAERALEEFAAGLGLAAGNDDPGIRAGLTELTREVGGHPAMRPGRVQQDTLRQLRELLAAPGR
jgi:maleylacetate reductase